MLDISSLSILLMFLAGLVAGIIDTLSGGGGLITVPALLTLGIDPATALGTNKLQGCIGELTASIRFMRTGHLKITPLYFGLFFTIIGASTGALVIQFSNPDIIKKIVPFLLALILLYTVLNPKIGKEDIHPRMQRKTYFLLFGLFIGFYNGFLGPSTGSFWIISLVYFLGFNMQKAVIQSKPLNFIGNVVSLVVFMAGGYVLYILALIMGCAQIIGVRIGSKLVIQKGSTLIRPFFISIVAIMVVFLFIKSFFL